MGGLAWKLHKVAPKSVNLTTWVSWLINFADSGEILQNGSVWAALPTNGSKLLSNRQLDDGFGWASVSGMAPKSLILVTWAAWPRNASKCHQSILATWAAWPRNYSKRHQNRQIWSLGRPGSETVQDGTKILHFGYLVAWPRNCSKCYQNH